MATTQYFSDTYHIDGEDEYVAVRKDQRDSFERMLSDQADEPARLKAELAAAKESGSNPDSGGEPNPNPEWSPRSRADIEADLAALDPSDPAYGEAVEAVSCKDLPPTPEPVNPLSGKSPKEINAETEKIFSDTTLSEGERDKQLAAVGGLVGPGENAR